MDKLEGKSGKTPVQVPLKDTMVVPFWDLKRMIEVKEVDKNAFHFQVLLLLHQKRALNAIPVQVKLGLILWGNVPLTG